MPQPPIVITGASTGMGKAAALQLAHAGHPLVLILREGQKGRDAHAEIVQRSGNRAVELEPADLSSQAEIHRAVDHILQKHNRIGVLLNNAGAEFKQRQLSVDGIEMTFAVNQMAPFLLTHLFYNALKAHGAARVVTTASSLQFPFDLADYNREKSYDGIKVYGQSKLANIQFTLALARRLEGTGITANCLAPGIVRTELFRQSRGINGLVFGPLGRLFMDSPDKAARKIVRLALDPTLDKVSGIYFAKDRPAKAIPAAYDEEASHGLWRLCERLGGL
ncbi:SDR family oxidoreductase [Devosia sp.]|uniref:SDR family oxidoreductase n=1 Tax=Devosia sp. TaxID=1871048 RepID=UPI003262F98D